MVAAFALGLGTKLLISHGIDERNGLAVMVEGPANFFDVAIPLHEVGGVDLAEAVGRDVLWQPEQLGGAFDVFPNGLPCPVAFRVDGVGKNPFFSGIKPQIIQQRCGQSNFFTFSGFFFRDPHLRLEFGGFEGQHVPHP